MTRRFHNDDFALPPVVLLALLVFCGRLAAADVPRQSVLVVVGAPGTEEYGTQFREWAARWQIAAERGRADFAAIGLADSPALSDREQLHSCLASALDEPANEPLWLVLIGHGTFDGKTARFNLRGPDVAPKELADRFGTNRRPVVVVACGSCSSPFLSQLSGPNRTIVTATRSGYENNFARFGGFLAGALTDPRADFDKDEQVSLLEAFLLADAQVREFYAGAGRLATEHALLDDNGDRLGTPAEWLQGLRAVKTAKEGAAPDGLLAAQLCLVRSRGEEQLSAAVRARRDELEQNLAQLRRRKSEFAEDEYLSLIEPLLVELSRLGGTP